MTRQLKLTLGLLLFALMLANLGARIYSRAYDLLNTSQCGWDSGRENGRFVISGIEAKSYPAVLHKGDEILSVSGQAPATSHASLRRGIMQVAPGTPYTMVIRCAGELHEVSMQTYGYTFFDWISQVFSSVIGLSFIAIGLAVLLLKSTDKQAWLLSLMLGTFAGIFNETLYNVPSGLLPFIATARVIALSFLPLFLHFFLTFPERSSLLKRFPRFEYYLYLPFLLAILPLFGASRFIRNLELSAYPFSQFLFRLEKSFSALGYVLVIAYLASGLLTLAASYRATSREGRRRLRVIVAGCMAGFLSIILVIVLEAFGFNGGNSFYRWLDFSLIITLPFIPISFAYAIIRHQVIPVSLIIRRGVRYMLVSRGSVLLEVIAVALIVTVVLTVLFSYLRPSGLVIGLISSAVGIGAWRIVNRLHERYLAPIIDQKFFRQSYDAQQVISDLAESIRITTNLPELLELVATRIHSALQTENVTIFLRDKQTGDFHAHISYDFDEAKKQSFARSAQDLKLPHYAESIARLDEIQQPLDLDLTNKDDELTARLSNRKSGPLAEWQTLSSLKATLLLPLCAKDGLLGVISLGPRLGDLPFSSDDKRLLMSVAGPVTFALENARLIERMMEEERQRRVIEMENQRKAQELAVARQIQLSMLPKRNLNLDRVEIIGEMRTATEVGGDYYDFIALEDGRYCIAVGDATGHGMAAGLVVGMVKMGLINGLQTLNGSTSTKRMVEDLNRALKMSLSQRGMGMCLGVAILDPVTLEVEIISSGMPFPFIYRSATGTLQPLIMQSPPLGFLKQINASPMTFQLEKDDALIWVSDGFGERLDHDNEIWGDEEVALKLEKICREESSAEAISRRLIEACDKAASGRNNTDDMTIVIAKVKP